MLWLCCIVLAFNALWVLFLLKQSHVVVVFDGLAVWLALVCLRKRFLHFATAILAVRESDFAIPPIAPSLPFYGHAKISAWHGMALNQYVMLSVRVRLVVWHI